MPDLRYTFVVPPKRRLRKIVDEISPVRCAAGRGVIREEVWEDETGTVARYDLTFINRFLTRVDNGRVLGYDNSHGYHHRHFKGTGEMTKFVSYEELARRFFDEVDELKRETL